jgi:hypothetical protein
MMFRLKNVEVYFSRDRPTGVSQTNSLIYHSGIGGFILENVNFNTYTDLNDYAFNIALFLTSYCNPTSSIPRDYNFTNVSMTRYQPESSKITNIFASMFFVFYGFAMQNTNMRFKNVTIHDFQDAQYFVWRMV